MIYYNHGLEKSFTSYNDYFDGGQDEDALAYLYLATKKMIHDFKPGALSYSRGDGGFPGLAADTARKGYGFDYRLSMGVPIYG